MIEGRTDEEKARHGRADHCGLARARGGAKAGDLARKHGISEATPYNWKTKYGGMEVCDAKRLRVLCSLDVHQIRLESGPKEGPDNEVIEVFRGTNHRGVA